MKEAVQAALAAIISRFGDSRVRAVPDGQGGAWVEITDVDLGESYTPPMTFVLFLLPFNLPNADVYPLYVSPEITRCDGASLGQGFGTTSVRWPGEDQQRPATQVSRRTRRNEFTRQTPLQKIEKVIEWIRTR